MNPGDVILYLGTIWHGAGANKTKDQTRMAITIQYCEPYIRTNENYFATVDPRDVLKMEPRLQSLLGYSIHSPSGLMTVARSETFRSSLLTSTFHRHR
jgi:ectoine hydroxylase-related dioxygenase (phytanoyl-CoA dioxygenase family)